MIWLYEATDPQYIIYKTSNNCIMIIIALYVPTLCTQQLVGVNNYIYMYDRDVRGCGNI